MKCRSCDYPESKKELIDFNPELELVLDLGNQPWCNDFRFPDAPPAPLYPLRLYYCPYCSLSQLDYTVKKEIMFYDHTYVSGTTKTLANHFFRLAEENKYQLNLQPDDLIVDIGGNDGTQLLQYKKLGFTNLLNVESARNIADISKNMGIETQTAFFNEDFVDQLPVSRKAKLINASGVFFHLEELHSVIRGIKKLLDPEGVFVVQFMYLVDIVKNCAFDAIYHEHLCYYTLESLATLLRPYGLVIFDAYEDPIHGGSMMAKIVHSTSHKNIPTARYADSLEAEGRNPLNLARLRAFADLVKYKKYEILGKLVDLKRSGAKIYGYGSPAKGTTLLNYCHIDTGLLDKLVEINDLKVGRMAPGSLIPIVKENDNDLPDIYFVLSWNFIEEILEKKKHLLDKVSFVVPLPEWKVYGKSLSKLP